MKHLWINRERNSELLVFFNGWGMDAKPFEHLSVTGLDVLMFYDYTTATVDCDIVAICATYKSSYLTAWSLGVSVAAATCRNDGNFASVTAINGTLRPIDVHYGIAPNVFQQTIAGWSEPARQKFNRRMCGRAAGHFTANQPERDIEEQKNELIAINHRMTAGLKSTLFDTAVIGLRDRIFPAAAQENYWMTQQVKIVRKDLPHYLFDVMTTWREVAEIGQDQ